MKEATDRVSSKRTCSLPVDVMEASGATAASVRMERTWRLTRSSAFFFSSAVMVEVCFCCFVAAKTEESALAILFLKEETAARARARIGAAGGVGGVEFEVEEEVEEEVAEEVEVEVSGNAPPAADANDVDATAVCLFATAAGALFGAEATRDVLSGAQTAGRAAAWLVRGGSKGRERWSFEGEVLMLGIGIGVGGRFRRARVCFDLSPSFSLSFSRVCPSHSDGESIASLTHRARGQHDFDPRKKQGASFLFLVLLCLNLSFVCFALDLLVALSRW